MPLTACRECGAAVPAHAHACPRCGAGMAPVPYAAYRPPPPPPPEEPERPWWRTGPGWLSAAGWVFIAAVGVLIAVLFVRGSVEAERRATERVEVAREVAHLLQVNVWVQDTSAAAPVPGSAGRPVPTSDRAKRMWVIGRMVVDCTVWRREVMERHGVEEDDLPAAWGTPRYYANARTYPEVGRYVEGRAAAVAEIEKTSAAWMEERIAALARESGMPAREVRDIFPPDFARLAPGEARLADAMLEMHRHFVRMDPRVHHAGGNQLRFERQDDLRRVQELEAEVNDALASAEQGRRRKRASESAVLSRVME